MKILENCWECIAANDCDFGGYTIENSRVKIYVNGGMDVDKDIKHHFSKKQDNGYVGHCMLIFDGVSVFNFDVFPYKIENDKLLTSDSKTLRYINNSNINTTAFYLSGGLGNLFAYVDMTIEAQKFTLVILDDNEN